jgi:hypothetical protein
MNTTNYQKQGEDFLSETKTTMTCDYLGKGNFDGDKPNWERRKYLVTFRRGARSKTFEFTGSASAHTNTKGDWTLERKEAQRKLEWAKNPTPYDVLACLQKYDVGGFKNFCADLGYDEDSRKAERTYFAGREEFEKVKSLWGDVLEKLQEIQ